MLSPDLKYSLNCISDIYNSMLQTDNVSMVLMSINLGKVLDEPEWVDDLRNQLKKLGTVTDEWVRYKADIVSDVMNPFMEYDSLFKVVAEGKNKFNKDEFIELIECLMGKAKEAKTKADNSKDKFDKWLKALKSNMSNVESNIDNGWKTLDEKEAEAEELVGAICTLEAKMNELQASISVNGLISEGKIIGTAVGMVISGVELGVGTILSFIGTYITIGKTYYDIIKDNEEVKKLIEEASEKQLKLSSAHQVLAQCKAILKFLYDLDKKAFIINDYIANVTAMWGEEEKKLLSVRKHLREDVEIKDIFEFRTLERDAAVWNSLKEASYRVIAGPEAAQSFNINVGNSGEEVFSYEK